MDLDADCLGVGVLVINPYQLAGVVLVLMAHVVDGVSNFSGQPVEETQGWRVARNEVNGVGVACHDFRLMVISNGCVVGVVYGIVGVCGVDEEPGESRFQSSRFGWCWVVLQKGREVERDFLPATAA